MYVNNMESVFKIFFRGMATIRVSKESLEEEGTSKYNFTLQSLAANKIVATRIRADTGVKQYHAGQIFDFL